MLDARQTSCTAVHHHTQVLNDSKEIFAFLMLSVLSFAFAYYILFRNDQDQPVRARTAAGLCVPRCAAGTGCRASTFMLGTCVAHPAVVPPPRISGGALARRGRVLLGPNSADAASSAGRRTEHHGAN